MRIAEDGRPVATEVFQRKGASVRDARQFVAAVLEEREPPDGLADTAELVVSELAANAVLHARAGVFSVTLRSLHDDQVSIAVVDFSHTPPTKTFAADEEGHGRDLALVEAVSQQWGTDPLRWGKRVCADLRVPAMAEAPAPGIPIYSSHRAQVVHVLMLPTVATAVLGGLATRS
ncbi:ATP-binding protein [Streptomyces sp. NPDC048737]|uniref:ATP-binding protein n=1 Tax=unclassified Streptomyces TaxID=2593676 RepID=UPI0034186433